MRHDKRCNNNRQKLKKLQELVNLQSEDEALWLCDEDVSVMESYLQEALRKLHTAIESENIEEIIAIIEDSRQ